MQDFQAVQDFQEVDRKKMDLNRRTPIRMAKFPAVAVLFFTAVLSFTDGMWAHEPNSVCGEGIEIFISSTGPMQGGVVMAELRSPQPAAELSGRWGKRDIFFWKVEGEENIYRALLGVDLNQALEPALLRVQVSMGEGRDWTCDSTISPQKGQYKVQHLNVDYKFVDLSEKDLARYRRDVARTRKLWTTDTPEQLWQGEFRAPLGDAKGSGSFGKLRVFNGKPRNPHTGEDFPAVTGTPVYAAQRGRVVLADDQFFSGNLVILDHGLGLYTLYAHLSSIDVKEGEMAEAESIIGKVGATGRVTGAHLHWGIRLYGARVNPQEVVKLLSSGN